MVVRVTADASHRMEAVSWAAVAEQEAATRVRRPPPAGDRVSGFFQNKATLSRVEWARAWSRPVIHSWELFPQRMGPGSSLSERHNES